MNVLSLHVSHDGCATYIKDNQIVFHTQIDRYNKIKHFTIPSFELIKIITQLEIDIILISYIPRDSSINLWLDIFNKYSFFKNKQIITTCATHHLFHVYCGLTWNKNIKNIIVVDQAGAPYLHDFERESFYYFDNQNITNIFIKTSFNGKLIGDKYARYNLKKFNDGHASGKTMALSLYDKEAFYIQQNFEKEMDELIKETNIQDELFFTGGCAQNVLYNQTLIPRFSKLFCDPFNGDFGISLGHANWYLNNKIKNTNVYLGIKQDLDLSVFVKNKIVDSSYEEVANILKEDPVAIFQSRSEQGQRGLGNRSLLMNPFNKNAQEKLNAIKKREYFRPFALAITEEESNNWFDMLGCQSPHMMYTFNLKNKNTNLKLGFSKNYKSRIQTVNIKDNFHFYNLLKRCENQVLVNTSLNLPGEVLVETIFDLKDLFDRSNLKYIYLPEIQKLIIKQYER